MVRVVAALGTVRAHAKLWTAAPAAVRNFLDILTDYVADPQVCAWNPIGNWCSAVASTNYLTASPTYVFFRPWRDLFRC